MAFHGFDPNAPQLFLPGHESSLVSPVRDHVPLIHDDLMPKMALAMPAVVAAELVRESGAEQQQQQEQEQ